MNYKPGQSSRLSPGSHWSWKPSRGDVRGVSDALGRNSMNPLLMS